MWYCFFFEKSQKNLKSTGWVSVLSSRLFVLELFFVRVGVRQRENGEMLGV